MPYNNKQVKTILYPSENTIQRWITKDYEAEMWLDNEDGKFKFNPPLSTEALDSTSLTEYIETVVGDIEGFPEAPIDGKQYARQDADWSEVIVPAGELETPITATVTVGGITSGTTVIAGTTYEQVFRSMLTPYQTSSLYSFSVGLTPSASIYEVGQTVTIGNATFTYTNDSNGQAPKNFVVSGTGFSGTYQASPITSNGAASQFATVSTKTWTLTAQNQNNIATNSLTFSRSAQWKYFYGALSAGTVTIDSLQQSKLNANQATSWTNTSDNTNTGNYTYIAYSGVYPDLASIVLNGAGQVLGAFTKQTDVSYTNAYGITQTYKVYRSNALGAFAVNDILTIS